MITTMSEAINQFDEMLDDCYTPLQFGDMSLAPSRCLREVDPIAYRTMFYDYMDSEGIETDDLEDDLDLP